MNNSINLFLTVGILLMKIVQIFSLPLNESAAVLYDQRQNGTYNIHLSIKDVSIVDIGGNDFEDYSDNDDYYYDDTALTIKPWGMFSKPHITTTTTKSIADGSQHNSSASGSLPLLDATTQSAPTIYVTPIVSSGNYSYLNRSNNDNLTSSNATEPQNANSIRLKETNSKDEGIANFLSAYQISSDKAAETERINETFRASQRDPLDVGHRVWNQYNHRKSDSKIFRFRRPNRSRSMKKAKKIDENCKNANSKKKLCLMRQRMNYLLMERLFNWLKSKLPDGGGFDSEK